MNRFTLFFVLFNSAFVYSQNEDKIHFIEYVNMSSFSISNNYENYYAIHIERENGASAGFDVNTIHGIKFFERVSIAAGISVDWNINKTFLSTPYILDFRIYSSRSNENGMFAYIQTGKNIKWTNSMDGNGATAKLGIGVIINIDDNRCFYLDLFKKSKEQVTDEFQNKGYYKLNGYGMSIGLTFN